jgi:hypothetical protein
MTASRRVSESARKAIGSHYYFEKITSDFKLLLNLILPASGTSQTALGNSHFGVPAKGRHFVSATPPDLEGLVTKLNVMIMV